METLLDGHLNSLGGSILMTITIQSLFISVCPETCCSGSRIIRLMLTTLREV